MGYPVRIFGNNYRGSFKINNPCRDCLVDINRGSNGLSGSSLVTALTGLTTVFSEDLISLTIKPKGDTEGVIETVVQQILDIL